jgi:bacterioferritin-associated ferredoxin
MLVCHCFQVSDRDIAAAVRAGHCTLNRVCRATGAARDCAGCVPLVRAVVSKTLQQATPSEPGSPRTGERAA